MKITVQSVKQLAVPIFKKYGVNRASLFGSFARGEETEKSDIDILIEPPKGMTLFDMAGLQIDLQESLKKPVDIITYRSIHPRLKDYILKDHKIFYEKR